MKKKSKRLEYRVYQSGELLVEMLPAGVPGPEKVIKLRFRTHDFIDLKESAGTTPWVTFTMDAMHSFSEQISAVLNAAEAWEPGQGHAPSIDTAGVEMKVNVGDGELE